MKKFLLRLNLVFVITISLFYFSKAEAYLDDYAFEKLSKSVISEKNYSSYSAEGLRILRNSIFAKYGYKFKSKDLQEYFSEFSWYSPRFDNVNAYLSDVESKNVKTLLALENNKKKFYQPAEKLCEAIKQNDINGVRNILSRDKSIVHKKCAVTLEHAKYFEFGDGLDIEEDNYFTSLFLAVRLNNFDISQLLIQAGADVNALSTIHINATYDVNPEYTPFDILYYEPLYRGAVAMEKTFPIALLLLKSGAKISPDAVAYMLTSNLSDDKTLLLLQELAKQGFKFNVFNSHINSDTECHPYSPLWETYRSCDSFKESDLEGNFKGIKTRISTVDYLLSLGGRSKTADFLEKTGVKRVENIIEREQGWACGCGTYMDSSCDEEDRLPAGILEVIFTDGSSTSLVWGGSGCAAG